MIPLMDLKAQYQSIKQELDAAAIETLESGEYILGSKVKAFEENFAPYCQAKECVAVNSGTSALHLALIAAGVKPGDEVITVSMTFIATSSAISYAGATPVYVDVDPVTWNMDPSKIEAAITPKTKAIIPVHLHGRMADMDAIMSIAKKHNLVVIEDAAQAHGAEDKGRRAGSIGDIGCFSFYAGKNLGACGEGGAIVTNNHEYAESVRLYRDWGAKKKYEHIVLGYNYRLEGLQGALLNVKLRHLERWTELRINRAARYHQLLKDYGIGLPGATPDGDRHVYHIFGIRVKDRDAVRQTMMDSGIGVGIHYPIPVHVQPCYAHLNYKKGDFPVTESLCNELLSLPLYAELTDAQIDEVCRVLDKAMTSPIAKAG